MFYRIIFLIFYLLLVAFAIFIALPFLFTVVHKHRLQEYSAVDKTRNMEHSGTCRNMPEHAGTFRNIPEHEKIK